jgi:UDP-glucose 4-epimerase
MKVVVTGGCGFIGNALVQKLLQVDAQVTILENFEGKHLRYPPASHNAPGGVVGMVPIGVHELCRDDGKLHPLLAEDDVEDALMDADYFCHFAAHYANEKSLKEPIKNLVYNIVGTQSCLMLCKKFRIKNFLYASSSGVYGGRKDGYYSEEMLPAPNTPYEISKYTGELLVRGFASTYGLRAACPRFFNVYGVGDIPGRWRSVIPNFFSRATQGLPIRVTGTRASRDFTYIDDVVSILLHSMYKLSDLNDGESLVFNIATGNEVIIEDLARKIISLVPNCKSKVTVEDTRNWDNAERRRGSTEYMHYLFPGYDMIGIDQGLHMAKDWYIKGVTGGIS